MDLENKILFLGGSWNCLSNFSSYSVEWKGETWMTSEHAYQAEKFDDVDIKQKIKKALSAYDSKMIAIEYKEKMKPRWNEDLRLGIMEEIIRAKLAQHPHIKKKLLQTGDKEIIENSKDDYFWGWGADQTGFNHHGKIWMKLRSELLKKD